MCLHEDKSAHTSREMVGSLLPAAVEENEALWEVVLE